VTKADQPLAWPPAVEEVAAVLRAAAIEARLEELPRGEDELPRPAVRALAFDCEGRTVVALIPADRTLDPRRLPCAYPRPVPAPAFPYQGAIVLGERTLLGERTIWIEAGSPRHVAELPPGELLRLSHAQTADLTAET
jgi:prolyl-tRNA editing enzyme YbaK/EbsC (Cys-tRNA(Pro) deacylase)